MKSYIKYDCFVFALFCVCVCLGGLQVLYLLNQLQDKPVCSESDETKQKAQESSKEKELLQRLKVQVCFHQSSLSSIFDSEFLHFLMSNPAELSLKS